MANKNKKSKPAVAPATAGEPSEQEAAKTAETKAAEENKKAPELSPELRARLKGIFQDDPEAEAYYSEDGETFLNADQYEARENKKNFIKYTKPE